MSTECGCVPGHRMTVLDSACADCGFTEREFAEHGNRPCVPDDPPSAEEVLRALNRVKVEFQARTIALIMGFPHA